MDAADYAEQQQSTLHSKRIHTLRQQAAKIDTSNPTGICLSPGCEGITGTARRFCDKLCAEIWERDIEN
jgi:hypothetical protein